MRCVHQILFSLLLCTPAFTQSLNNTDSIKKALLTQPDNIDKVTLLYKLAFSYTGGSYADSALIYSKQALKLAEQLRYEPGQFWSLITSGEAYAVLGNYPMAMECSFKALALSKKLNDTLMMCYGNGSLASCYYYMGNYPECLVYARNVLQIIRPSDAYWMWIQMSRAFHDMGEADSALIYARMAFSMTDARDFLYAKGVVAPVLGDAYAEKHMYDSALFHYRKGIDISEKTHTQKQLIDNYYGIARVHHAKKDMDSALWYGKKIINEKIINTYPLGLLRATDLLADIYEATAIGDSALKYLKFSMDIKDSLNDRQKTIAVQNLVYKEQEKQLEMQAYQRRVNNRLILFIIIAVLLIAVVIGGIWLKNRRQAQLQKIRNSIADDLHDDIGSTLSSISIMSELGKTKSPEAARLLTSIGESTMAIQENMSDIVWTIKSDNDSFENVMQRVNLFAYEILGAKNIAFAYSISDKITGVKLTMKQRKNIYLFFKEAINNAAKHSNAKNVFVAVGRKSNYFEISVRDDGNGFDTEKEFQGNGLDSFKNRAAELNGRLGIESGPTRGTEIKIFFKIT